MIQQTKSLNYLPTTSLASVNERSAQYIAAHYIPMTAMEGSVTLAKPGMSRFTSIIIGISCLFLFTLPLGLLLILLRWSIGPFRSQIVQIRLDAQGRLIEDGEGSANSRQQKYNRAH